ncbi:hypothetical protein ABFS82_14G224100 [Erythranthe guttata]
MDKKEDSKEAGEPCGKILVKLRLPKMPEVEDQVKTESPAAAAADEETRSRCCRECGRIFSSGKALGGHMSSAHVQANKDLSAAKKLKNKHSDGCSSSSSPPPAAARHPCGLCNRSFRSQKSLFGHMRCHPDRLWRGMAPPLPTPPPPHRRRINSDEHSPDSHNSDPGPHAAGPSAPRPVVDMAESLRSWPTSAKRNRGPIRPAAAAADDKDLALAHQLVKMSFGEVEESTSSSSTPNNNLIEPYNLNNHQENHFISKTLKRDHNFISGPESDDRPSSKKLKIRERDDDDDFDNRRAAFVASPKIESCKGKGKEKVPPPLMLQPDVIDSDDESCLIAMNDLMMAAPPPPPPQPSPPLPPPPAGDNKRNPITNQENGKLISSSPQKYTCDVCHKTFKSHQALGGHRSSHNKFKFSVTNTDDCLEGEDGGGARIKKDGAKVDQVDESAYVCEICKMVFTSGQALGGHKRRHSTMASHAAILAEASSKKPKVVLDFDLNEPPKEQDNDDDGEASNH